ncbi:MAG: CYTH domain-containing protein [Phycisphaerales bacterium]|nr:CYTH domain-containing protein [Phycisphaerales bacterium]
MQNVEFKCELRDPDLARLIAAKIGAKPVGVLRQTDSYYRIPDGRLKKRETEGEPTEYVFYHRLNRVKPKLSHFSIYSEEQFRERYGEAAAEGGLPLWVIVRKSRQVWMWTAATSAGEGSVRLHADEVEGLGWFFEAEALVSPRQHLGICHEIVENVREAFGPALGEMIAVGYSDMLAAQQQADPPPGA